MGVLQGLKPTEVFRYFEEICAIPHGSYDTKRISDYCVKFAEEHGLPCVQDEWNNVVIIKEASEGYERAETVMLQGHLDMVCEKTADSDHDFKEDGLQLEVDDKYISAKNTTLGGDDGIAVAYALAILADHTLKHPRLEVLLTAEEEVGMDGAKGLDTSELRATRMINLDSEEEGYLLTSCAGGFRGNCVLPISRETCEGLRIRIRIYGLLGGHSGIEINTGRANSNKLMGRLLTRLQQKQVSFRISGIAGGLKDNAIPNDTTAELLIQEADLDALKAQVQELQSIIRAEYSTMDPDVQIICTTGTVEKAEVLLAEDQQKVLFFLLHCPNGVINMSTAIEGLVQTSLNLGVFALKEDEMRGSFAVRSSVASEKEELAEKLQSFIGHLGGSYDMYGDYPAWEYRADSLLRDTMIRIYNELYGKAPEVEAIHAGLECGILLDKMRGMDCVSIGPDMFEVHTVNERLDIVSVGRVWQYLLKVLEALT